ncbi:MAG: hypothetical protein FJ335_04050 [Sphingomonadales bacterium]|nr:hypothetical protein [Sphingomonadales bacterium]
MPSEDMTQAQATPAGQVEVTQALLPCPFCGGEAKRITIEDGVDQGGDVIYCTGVCGASSHVAFGRKENLVSLWNCRAPDTRSADVPVHHIAGIGKMAAELAKQAEDWRHNGYTRVYLAQLHDRLAALSPTHTVSDMGVDAPQRGGEVLRAFVQTIADMQGDELDAHGSPELREAARAALTADKPEDTQAKSTSDRLANDAAAKALYDSWSSQPGWVPWVERGNSDMQEEARRLAARSGAE